MVVNECGVYSRAALFNIFALIFNALSGWHLEITAGIRSIWEFDLLSLALSFVLYYVNHACGRVSAINNTHEKITRF